MTHGIVKFFNRTKNFGFITPTDEAGNAIEGANDVFVHGTNVIGESIEDGDAVMYEVGEGRKGPEAKDVKKVGTSAGTEEDMDMAA